MGDGEIASDFRQHYDIWGAHVSSRNSKRNMLGIGICVIGNLEQDHLEQDHLTNRQYRALLALTLKLMREHDIELKNVSGHGFTPGESTKCPGKNFPMQRFFGDLAFVMA